MRTIHSCSDMIGHVRFSILLLVLLSVLVGLVDARLTYPYAAGTPGIQGGPLATGGAVPGLVAGRRLEDRGADGRAGGAGGPRQFQCDELVRAIGTHVGGLGGGHAANIYLNDAPVIGIAIVDHGGNGNTFAYFSKSNGPGGDPATGAAALKTEIAAVINAWNPGGGGLVDARYTNGAAYLTQLNHWSMIDFPIPPEVNRDLINAVTANVVLNSLPTWTRDPAVAWSSTELPNPLAPETIQFAPVRGGGGAAVSYVKRWWQNNQWRRDTSTNRFGACALQKLVSTLRGFGAAPLELFPVTNLARPFVGVGGSRFVCVAEAAYGQAFNNLVSWDGTRPNYPQYAEVPSCAFCQAVVPKMLDGSFQSAGANCQMAMHLRPQHTSNRGNCAAVAHGARCSVTCNAGYDAVPIFTVCHRGAFAPLQTCAPRGCALTVAPPHATGVGNCANVVHNAQCTVMDKSCVKVLSMYELVSTHPACFLAHKLATLRHAVY